MWDRAGGYDPRFPVYEDWEFLIRATKEARVKSFPFYHAISRTFTGQPGAQEHFYHEQGDCRRCLAAARWKHRSLCPSGLQHYRPAELRLLLVSWWWLNQLRRLRNR